MRVRSMYSRIFFDKDKTDLGYKALKNYCREYDEKRHVFKDAPLHDWTSHAADAFSILPNIGNSSALRGRRKAVSKKHSGRFR